MKHSKNVHERLISINAVSKKMKTLFLMLLVTLTASAQNYKHSLQGVEWVKIESSADVVITTHNGSELLIEGGERHVTPEQAKGLKLVGESGKDNTDVGFQVTKEGNSLIVKNLKKGNSAKILLPASQNVSVTTNWSGDIELNGFKSEIEATAKLNGSIEINDISGPLTANSLNGKVKVRFAQVSQESPITIYSTNGVLDIGLNGRTPANLSLGTTNGSIYTDFDLKMPEKDGLKPVATKRIKATINNGGVAIQLKTTNGSIYLRKQ